MGIKEKFNNTDIKIKTVDEIIKEKDTISIEYHIRFCRKLLKQVSICETDNENLSMFMLSVDLNKLRCEIECEIREYE